MSKDRERFDKIWALAVNPGAKEGEALAAFNIMRDLVRSNPSLAHPPAQPPTPPPPQPQNTFRARITSVHPDWQLILIGLLSSTAYDLKLVYKISFDFGGATTAIVVLCEGSPDSCNIFEKHADWCIEYINTQLRENK